MNTTGLARLSGPALLAWLLARMREQDVDPPVDASRLESPDDYPRAVYVESRDSKFRTRLEKATVAALREVAAGDLKAGPDTGAARHLAALADGIDLRSAEPVLKDIALRGAFGGHAGGLEKRAEETVLLALAALQQPGSLWPKWLTLWKSALPHLWPVATVGLRFSDPQRALEVLPEAVERATEDSTFPLGEVLWAYATDERLTERDIANALDDLSPEHKERCRAALRDMGAEEAELDAWLPRIGGSVPDWARISPITHCPRITEFLGCR